MRADGRSRVGTVRSTRSLAWHVRYRAVLVVTDTLTIGLTLFVAGVVHWSGLDGDVGHVIVSSPVLAVAVGVLWLLVLAAVRSRLPRILGGGLEEYRRVANATVVAFGGVAILAYLLQLSLSRSFFLVAMLLGMVMLVVERWVMRQFLRAARKRGRYLDRALVVGRVGDVHWVEHELQRGVGAGIAASAVLELSDAEDEAELRRERLAVVQRAVEEDVDVVVVAGELPGGADAVRQLSWELERTRADLVLAARLTDIAGPRIHLRPLAGIPFVQVSLPRFTGWSFVVKRAMDVVLASLALFVLAPVLLAVAIAVKLEDRGPVLYRQRRVGTNGEPFQMLKFRSMRPDADRLRADLQARNEGAGPLFKLKNDPRVTRVGKYLRAFSLDELPQFVNVLLGEMSVVGPRPPLPDEVELYDRAAHRRLLIKPGITGLWQVSGRSNLPWDESLRLDLSYVENWSPLGDLAIVARTAVAVLRREGAY